MCFTNVNKAGIRYRYFMYSTNKCTDFNKKYHTNVHALLTENRGSVV